MKRKIFVLILALALLVLGVTSCAASTLESSRSLTVSGLTVDVYSRHGEIVRLTVREGDRVKVSLDCRGSDVTVTDLNFDGYDDIRVTSSVRSG